MNDEDAAAEAIASLTSTTNTTTSNDGGDVGVGEGLQQQQPARTVGSSAATTTTDVVVEFAEALSATNSTTGEAEEEEKGGGGGSSRRKYKKRVKDPEHKFTVQPRVIQVIHKPKRYVNHSYRDFSSVPPDEADIGCGGYVIPKIDEMTFAEKLHHMLSESDFESMIGWMPHGRAFKVFRPSDFERRVMPMYFGHSRYSSFLSMIRQHGLKNLTRRGPDQGCLYHEFMLRSLPHLAKCMPLPRNPRRLEDDPENEPDLYAISNLYPVLAASPKNTSMAQQLPQAVGVPMMEQQQQQQQQQQQLHQPQMIMTAQPVQQQQQTFLAPAGLVGYPQPGQFYFTTAAPASYATAAPQFITTYPSVGSYPTMIATTTTTAAAPVAQFAAPAPQMFSPQFIMAAPAPAAAAPTLINTTNGQPVYNFAAPNMMATSAVASNTST